MSIYSNFSLISGGTDVNYMKCISHLRVDINFILTEYCLPLSIIYWKFPALKITYIFYYMLLIKSNADVLFCYIK